MKAMKLILIATFLTATAVGAQEPPPFTRTVLQKGDLSVAGHEAVTAKVDIPQGVSVGKHTHPGEEVAYVMQGTMQVEIEGVAKTVKAGEPFLIPAGKVHDAKNIGTGPAQVLATYIVEKGKPLATPVK
jgi:quercetin dioxygenase-like cupin family protein